MATGGRPAHILRQVVERYPTVMHGVSMSIGSTDPLDLDYLGRLKDLAQWVQPLWISDHLCWTGVLAHNTHDLLPLPLNRTVLDHVAMRVRQVQDVLDRPLVLENPSTYVSFVASDMTEWAFLSALCEATGCGLLLDVNNVYVSAFNNGFDPVTYIEGLPHDRIVQMHLAGHQELPDAIVDTHDTHVRKEVWELFSLAWERTGGTAVCVEWDHHIPSFEDTLAEVNKARAYMHGFVGFSGVAEPRPGTIEPVSNPVGFMVTDMQHELGA